MTTTESRPFAEAARHGRGGRGRAATTPSSPRCSTTTGRPRSYDDKWSISYDKRCIDYARGRFDAIVPERGATRTALRPGAGTGLRQRLLPAQPDPGRGGAARLGDRPVAGHGQGRHPQRAEPGPGRSTAGSPTPRASRTTTTPSTWWSGTPCCTTFPTSSCRCARWCGCSSRAGGSCSPASRPL